MLCQAEGRYKSAAGDSGSPVWSHERTVTRSRDEDGFVTTKTKVVNRVQGIHWGGGGWFSPISEVQRSGELGLLLFCYPGSGC